MLRQFVRGYGVLIACSLVLLAGLVIYQEFKQDVLAYSLELVGDKLVDMSPKQEDKAAIAAIYDTFKERVLAKEVPPAQVEHVAANVLNLNRNGAVLTPEQAAAMLEPPMLSIAASDAAPGPSELQPISPDSWQDVGERIKKACEFENRVQEIVRVSQAEGLALKEQIHYECKDGLRVAMDAKLGKLLAKELPDNLSALEKEAMVVWHERMEVSMKDMRQRIEENFQVLSEDLDDTEPDLKSQVEKLKALKMLSRFDYHFDEDELQSVAHRIKVKMEKFRKDLKEKIKEKEPKNSS